MALSLARLSQRPVRIHAIEDLAPTLRDLSESRRKLDRAKGAHLQAAKEGDGREQQDDDDYGDQPRHAPRRRPC